MSETPEWYYDHTDAARSPLLQRRPADLAPHIPWPPDQPCQHVVSVHQGTSGRCLRCGQAIF